LHRKTQKVNDSAKIAEVDDGNIYKEEDEIKCQYCHEPWNFEEFDTNLFGYAVDFTTTKLLQQLNDDFLWDILKEFK